jgi:aryl carrier-like protein
MVGEPLPGSLVDRLYATGHVEQVLNLYGPTETTVYATAVTTRAGVAPTLGRPVGGARIYILDRHLAPVGVGMAGELYIGGAGVARGYVNRSGLTAERFLPDPFATPGARMYRTGDLARWRADGEIDYLGRLDDQVKIRGFRIELGEIEAALRRHPAVREAVVKAHTQPAPGGGERKMLVAYIVGDAEDGELRRYLAEQLPSYMVPQAYARLDALPLTANGKLDRKALPAASLGEARGSVAPRDATEATLVEIWQSVLDLAGIGVEDDFFELGGDSIISLQVVARARQAGLKLSARDLFQHRTIANLARIARLATAADAVQVASPSPATFALVNLSPEELDRITSSLVPQQTIDLDGCPAA